MPDWVALGIDDPFLHQPAEGRGVVDLAAEQCVQRVGMGVEMHHAERLAAKHAAQDRQGDRVVAARRDRCRPLVRQLADELRDHVDAAQQLERVDGRIAQIGDTAQPERSDPAGGVDATNDA